MVELEFLLVIIFVIVFFVHRSKDKRADLRIEDLSKESSETRELLLRGFTDNNIEASIEKLLKSGCNRLSFDGFGIDDSVVAELKNSISEMPWVTKPLEAIVLSAGGKLFCKRILLANRGKLRWNDAFGGSSFCLTEESKAPVTFFGDTPGRGKLKFAIWVRDTIKRTAGQELTLRVLGWHGEEAVPGRTTNCVCYHWGPPGRQPVEFLYKKYGNTEGGKMNVSKRW